MAELCPFIKHRFDDENGNPLAGGKLYSYTAGTTTPKATYTDSTELSANTNPIILDANGECNLWIGIGYYKFVLKDSADVVQWTVDNVAQPGSSAQSMPAAGLAGQVLTKNTNSDYDAGWATPIQYRCGRSSLNSAVQQVSITFSSALSSANYAVTSSFENTTDADPIFLTGYISARSTTGFTFKFNAPTDSANYVFHYKAILDN